MIQGQTRTHTNVVLGGVGSNPELYNTKHVLNRKHRDLLWLKHVGTLQVSEILRSSLTRYPHTGDGYSKSLLITLT
jgi:hypothetical protein